MPSLRDLLDAYQQHESDATLWIELKSSPYQRDISSHPNALVSQVIEDVVSARVQHRTVLLAFEWDALRFARSLNSQVATDFLTLNPAHVIALNRKLGPIDPYLLFGVFDPRRHGDNLPKAIALSDPDLLVRKIGVR